MQKVVKIDDNHIRLDRWLKENISNNSYINIQKIIRTGQVRVGGRRKKSDYRVLTGDIIRIPPEYFDKKSTLKQNTSNSSFSIEGMRIYEDESVLVINKPYGLSTQGGTGVNIHVDGLLKDINDEVNEKYRLVHRLDKHTSGVLLIAKRREVAQFYMLAFKNKLVKKQYVALVNGKPLENSGVISKDLEIKYQNKGDLERIEKKQDAQTTYKVLDTYEDIISFLEVHPLTGRKHQIRKHLSLIGNPVLGDKRYGEDKLIKGLDRKLYLHSQKLVFPSFGNKKNIEVDAEMPDYFCNALKILNINANG
ncbi:MAG: RluA family pseudouridine synthase [Hyphomicrobiales bacterium]|jgi:23S rRNA pseudouridine955/2504/2580 synthase|nr:RluA family pseudouridine synthase [Hyphomicrobiales bacterium]